MTLLIHFSVTKSLRESIKTTVQSNLFQYFNYINQEIGSPPNLDTAKRLSQTLATKIVITGEKVHWSSDGIFPHILEKEDINTLYIHISNQKYNTVFIVNKHLPSIKKILFKTILSILISLILLYFIVSYILHPLKTIQKGIQHISTGDMQYRIQIHRQDEFGELAQAINQMADDIKHMLEAKQQLLLAISHELRSPLTRLKVALSLMDKNQNIVHLEKNVNEMTQLIHQLLEFERFNYRHQTLNLKQVDVNQLIADDIKKQYPNDPIEQQLDPTLAQQKIDRVRWQLVIRNLLSNALKYRKNKGDSIIICTKQRKKDWLLSVIDTGIGIAKKEIPLLTEPFYRTDSSRQRKTGGQGLGLYLVKMIIESHQGNLKIESEEGEGTTITITMQGDLI